MDIEIDLRDDGAWSGANGRARHQERVAVDERPRPVRTIPLAAGRGFGPTALAAFDGALAAAGVANLNLSRLSSVIPDGSRLQPSTGPLRLRSSWGDRLYAVWAEQRAEPGAEAWAGVGWVQAADDGPGLFVEHEGHDEREVRSLVSASLTALCRRRPEHDFGPRTSIVIGASDPEQHSCALVIAAYAVEGWPEGSP
jgi:arginine decarboxylase